MATKHDRVSPSLAQGGVALSEQLCAYHAAGEKAGSLKVGTEYEMFGYRRSDLRPLHYSDGDKASIRTLLEAARERLEWPVLDDNGAIIGLCCSKQGASLTLEPGGQIELSGGPMEDIHGTAQEQSAYRKLMQELGQELGIAFGYAGFRPVWGADALDWMPKRRYGIMRDYLPTRGSLAHLMMQRTCTVQANLDYTSEADMGRKLRVSMALQPLFTAMFANSPFTDGSPNGYRSFRGHIWSDVDPDRCGLQAWVFDGDVPGYERYVRYAKKVPLFFIERDGRYLNCAGLPFDTFCARGFEGHHATVDDYTLHLSTIFTEVRLKTYLEVRGADCVPPELLVALPAISRGILYHSGALDAAWDIVKGWSFDERLEHRSNVTKEGLAARSPRGHTTQDLCLELLTIARGALAELSREAGVADESVYLNALSALVTSGQSPADVSLSWWGSARRDSSELISHYLHD